MLRPRSQRATASRRGLGLIDSVVAMSILTIAMGGLLISVVASAKLVDVNDQKAQALDGLQAIKEELRSVPFGEIFAAFNADPEDDPVGLAGVNAASFEIEGLRADRNDPDGLPGEVEFPTVRELDGSLSLREDIVDQGLGMPRDLNGDGAIDSLDHSTDYVLLPVRIRATWSGPAGVHSTHLEALLTE